MHCVVPENIHTPPPPRKGLEIPEAWGVKGLGISGEGGGVDLMNFFFFQTRLNIIFIQLYVKFRCLHFTSRVADAKKNKSY